MKNVEVLKLWNGIRNIDNRKSTKFSYVIMRNKNKLKETVDTLQILQIQKVEGQKEFEEERVELCRQFARKDERGRPIQVVVPGTNLKSFDIDDLDGFNEKMDEILLTERHQKYRENLRQRQVEFNELLLKDAGHFDFVKIPIEDLPDDLTTSEMEVIEHFLVET